MSKPTVIDTTTGALAMLRHVIIDYIVSRGGPVHPNWDALLAHRVSMVRATGWLIALKMRLPRNSALQQNVVTYRCYHNAIKVLLMQLNQQLKASKPCSK